jgi:yeast amino acid transporter
MLIRGRYTMVIVFPLLYFGYKLVNKTKLLDASEVDLQRDLDQIADYEKSFIASPPK